MADPITSWNDVEQAEPDFAQRVRSLFEAGRHKTIATLRADGSPRISGIECEFVDGQLQFGTMDGARKLADLLRDPRFALHGPTFHPEPGKENEWPGEAKIAGRAIQKGRIPSGEPSGASADTAADTAVETGAGADQQPSGELFIADITEVVVTGLNEHATKLVVEFWSPEHGLRRVERD